MNTVFQVSLRIRLNGIAIPILLSLFAHLCVAQETNQPLDDGEEISAPSELARQIDLLEHSNFRTRQNARWRIEQSPNQALEVIPTKLATCGYNVGSQLVDILTVFATSTELEISLKSLDILKEAATRLSSVGGLASNALLAIAELREEEAIEILSYHKARIGLPNFKLNAQTNTGNDLSLRIGDTFTGDDDAITWIRFLKSVETVYFEGEKIDSRFFKAIAPLKGIKNVKLRQVNVTKEDLKVLKNFDKLELLELAYLDADDSFLETLAELPMSQSLRLYGTKISREGAKSLSEQLDGLDIYCGLGGFLGVATAENNTRVTLVVRGSAADVAGIQANDILTKVNGNPIATFGDLREELGQCVPSEKITIEFRRLGKYIEVDTVLTKDPP